VGTAVILVVSNLKTVVLVVENRTIIVPVLREPRVKVTGVVIIVPRQRMNPVVVAVALEKLVTMDG
tara:strand:- start:323 stop:520 length:198 start_codon:yes stop_codon:yes gene_type:complete